MLHPLRIPLDSLPGSESPSKVADGVVENFPQECFVGHVADSVRGGEMELALGYTESFGGEHPLHECKVLIGNALRLPVWMRAGLEGGSKGLETSKCLEWRGRTNREGITFAQTRPYVRSFSLCFSPLNQLVQETEDPFLIRRKFDDDNIYSVDLIGRMRQIRHFGTWTVTKLVESNSRAILEGPICNGTRVIGWHTNEVSRRFWRFHAEMSGFAFNSTILWDPKRWHWPALEPIRPLDTVNEGIQVSTFMEQVVEDESQMECLPQNCSRIMIWHLHVESSFSYPPEWFLKYNNQDIIAPLA
ncbi:putative beta-1,4-xylosyltransferase IRX9H [Camellia lanceoleosa]|uniref:Beta-1,4-xylosyltransferase IRX9H n=1 Tax=Camellia lanceoleosa TaxID=1840588 RepID=A0ACC0G4G5_9ERIC|nr:putative beta-1,4-xylosyltransferase IRX9H [Camellia lanceoleosa]